MCLRQRGLQALVLSLAVVAIASGQGAPGSLLRPAGAAYDAAGDLFIADAGRNQILEVPLAGGLTVVAGTGVQGFAGDGGAALSAELNAPEGVAVSADGSVYIADTGNQRIRVVRSGSIATFAGTGHRGFAGDGGRASTAWLDDPVGLAVDQTGALLICDRGNQRVRRVSNGIVTTLAGNGVQGQAGDGGIATSAELNDPSGLSVGGNGAVYIADTGNERIRVVTTDGKIATFAGMGSRGFGGDGGPAVKAALSGPRGLAMDSAGGLLIADANNRRVRRVAPDGTIATVIGSGVQGVAADKSAALAAALNEPLAAVVSSFGWPLVADAAGHRLSAVMSDGRLYAPAGMGTGASQVSAVTPDAVYGTAQAAVNVTSSPGAAFGTVQVLESGAALGQGTISGGTISVALPALSAGKHSLQVAYSGDGVHPASTSTASIAVSPASVVATAAAAQVSYGAPLPALAGSISGVLPQDSGRVTAVYSAQAPATPVVGSYPIVASLSGEASGNYSVMLSPASGSLTVVPATAVATISPVGSAYEGLPLQLSARVASTTSGTPTGSVQFLDGSAVIATAQLVNGSATAVYLAPAAGQHAFSVSYAGDGNFLQTASPTASFAVAAMPDFAVSVAGNSQQTVLAGSAASYRINVASAGSPFTGAVMLSASGLPAGASATFSPTAVVPGASSAPVTMTITTAAQTAQAGSRDGMLPVLFAAGLVAPLIGRRRRGLVALLGAVFLCFAAGCGTRTVPESSLPAKDYAITVNATSTNLAGSVVTHSVSVTLGIQ